MACNAGTWSQGIGGEFARRETIAKHPFSALHAVMASATLRMHFGADALGYSQEAPSRPGDVPLRQLNASTALRTAPSVMTKPPLPPGHQAPTRQPPTEPSEAPCEPHHQARRSAS